MEQFKINNKIRLIETFSGIGSQAMAFRNIGAEFEKWVTCDWWVQSIATYKAIHCANDTTDYSAPYTKDDLTRILYRKGISNDGKTQMPLNAIQKKPESWLRNTYNNIQATRNLVDITTAHGRDLYIVEPEKYTYILTYSFPCQDLSKAGKMQGMDKGSGTRSGMLWEVERLLEETPHLPQVLLMENVPQVMGNRNLHNFNKWQQFLESKGYKNYAKILNAKDYGVAQNRQRAYMVSILGDCSYKFPEAQPLTKSIEDYYENEVDKSYYMDAEKVEKLITEYSPDGKAVMIRQATKAGAIRWETDGVADLSFPTSKTRRGRVQEGGKVCATIMAGNQDLCKLEYEPEGKYRARKLTPRERWRLFGFSDSDYDKAAAVNNDASLTAQAGNAIVVDVLEAIFKEMICKQT